jgi:hypothetical protein
MKCKKKKTYQIWLGEKSEWDRTTGRSQLKRSKMQTKSKWVQLISAGLWPSPLPLNKLLWEWWWWEDSSEREILGQLGALERKQRGKWRPLNSPGSASLWRKTLQLAMLSFVSVSNFFFCHSNQTAGRKTRKQLLAPFSTKYTSWIKN